MALGFVATVLLSINAALAEGKEFMAPVWTANNEPVVRTAGAYDPTHPDHVAHVKDPVLRVHQHKELATVDGKGEAHVFEQAEPEVPPVVHEDRPRAPIFQDPLKAMEMYRNMREQHMPAKDAFSHLQQSANESASSKVVRAEKHVSVHQAGQAEISEEVGVSGEAVQSRIRNRARKHSANGMALEEGHEKLDELPKINGTPAVVRAQPATIPTGLSELSAQWPPSGAANETHVVIVFLALGLAAGVLAFAGVCGGFAKADSKGPRSSHDVLADDYASAASPGVAARATAAPATSAQTGAFMTPVNV
jgi:hypothetical protein